MDPETKRAWHRLQREVRENTPIVLRGLASSAKRFPRNAYSTAARGFKSLARRAKEWEMPFGARKPLISRPSRVRLRSPIYRA